MDLCDEIGAFSIDLRRVGEPVKRDEYQPEEVVKACGAALEREPNNPRFHFQLGMAFMALRDVDNAIRHLTIATEHDYIAALAVLDHLYRKAAALNAEQQRPPD